MKPSIFCSRFLRLPLDAETIHGCQSLVDRLEHAFNQAEPNTMYQVSAWLARQPVRHRDLGPLRTEQLEHELSDYMMRVVSDTAIDGRSLVELEVMRQLPPAESVLDEDAFMELLLLIHRRVCGRAEGFRRGDIQTQPDRMGNCVRYPPFDVIVRSLGQLYGYWHEHAVSKRGLAAVVILAAVTNLHPFQDGNGRVARVLFNHLLNGERDEPIYLPLHEIAALSRGGFLIRLRQAQYHAEWVALFDFLADCAETLFVPNRGSITSAG
jgi:hypothetical protein